MKEYDVEFCLSTRGHVIVSANDKDEAIRMVKLRKEDKEKG